MRKVTKEEIDALVEAATFTDTKLGQKTTVRRGLPPAMRHCGWALNATGRTEAFSVRPDVFYGGAG